MVYTWTWKKPNEKWISTCKEWQSIKMFHPISKSMTLLRLWLPLTHLVILRQQQLLVTCLTLAWAHKNQPILLKRLKSFQIYSERHQLRQVPQQAFKSFKGITLRIFHHNKRLIFLARVASRWLIVKMDHIGKDSCQHQWKKAPYIVTMTSRLRCRLRLSNTWFDPW